MASADRLIFACREDTAILTSLRAWLGEKREHIKEQLVKELDQDEVLRLQGAARYLQKLADEISQQVKVKDRAA